MAQAHEVDILPPIVSTDSDGRPLIHVLKLAPWNESEPGVKWMISPTINGEIYYTPECPKPNTLYRLEKPAFEILLRLPNPTKKVTIFEIFYCEKLDSDHPPRIADLKFKCHLIPSNFHSCNLRWFQCFYYRIYDPKLVETKDPEKELLPCEHPERVEGAPFRVDFDLFGHPEEWHLFGHSVTRFYGKGLPHERKSMARRGNTIEEIGLLESNCLYHAYADILFLKNIPGTSTELFYCNIKGIERHPQVEDLTFKKCMIGKDHTVKLESVWYFYILERDLGTKL